MNHERVKLFKQKLDNFKIADYHGLKSPGLTCYLNSVLQVLFMTEDLREAVKRSCCKDSTTIDLHLQRLFADLERKTAKTKTIIEKLGITNVYEQRDAAEYFEKILHLISPGVSKIFKGELNHKTKCLQCENNNDSRSFFWILPLVVEDSHHQTYSVEQGVNTFFKGETVSGDNRMYCNQCHEKREAEVMCEITEEPEILTLLLKRFRFDNKQKCYVKLHCKVDVPQTLHVKSCTYNLYALVHHYGNLTGGHYTAEIKSFETREWYCFNDDTVEMISQSQFGTGNTSVSSYTAYLLMYRKGSTHSENSEDELEDQYAHPDVEAEGRCEEAARGEDLVPHHQLRDEHSNEGKNLNDFNGDISEKRYDDTLLMKHKNIAGKVEKPLKETVAHQSEAAGEIYKPSLLTQKAKHLKMKTDEPDEEQHTPTTQQHKEHMCRLTTRGPPTEDCTAHHVDSRFEQNLNFPKERLTANDITWERQDNTVSQSRPRARSGANSSPTGNTVNPAAAKVVKNKQDAAAEVRTGLTRHRHRKNTDASVDNSSVKSFPVFSNSCHSHTICEKANMVMQHFVEATQGEKTANLRKTRKIKNNSEDNVQRVPWR